MEYIREPEKFSAHNRDFAIYTYRDNNNNRLQLDAYEIINQKRELILTGYASMNGKFNLQPEEYSEYSGKLANLKQLIIILFSPDFKNRDIDAPIPGFEK